MREKILLEPLLSIIIPVYNTEKYVEKCIDSIFSQTYSNIEVIIVNNGSSGNIKEIVKNYQNKYPYKTLKIINHKENQGTFHGRGSGMKIANGKYFTFMDADDRVGTDYFYQMIKKAEETNAEIVITDLVHEDENGHQFRYIEDPVLFMDIDIKNKEKVFDFYYGFQGLSYSMYGIWNKVYKIDLWNRSKIFIDAIKEHFALCEDAVYTTIFFSQAQHIVNIHNQFYYHYVRADSASGSLISSIDKAKNNAVYQGTAFKNMKQHLKRAGLYEKYKKDFIQFKLFHLKVMLFQVQNSKFSWKDKIHLNKFICDAFDVKENEVEKLSLEEMFFTTHFVEQTSILEKIRDKILSGKYKTVVFDIFNVLLLNNSWQDRDIFDLMEKELSKSNKLDLFRIKGINSFKEIRFNIENTLRNDIEKKGINLKNITINDIYDRVGDIYKLSVNDINILKSMEIEYRKRLLIPRNMVKELLDLANRRGLNIILLENTILDKKIIEKFLISNNYSYWNRIYLSSELGKNKYELLKKIKNENEKNILYFTSEKKYIKDEYINNIFDICYIPKTKDIIMNNCLDMYYGGNVINETFSYLDINKLLLVRFVIMQAANKFFDNPFVQYDKQSNYNGNPYYMGYLAGGTYIIGFISWLVSNLNNKNIKEITVIEGDIFEKLISLLMEKYKYNINLVKLKKNKNIFDEITSLEEIYMLYSLKDLSNITMTELIDNLKFLLKSDVIEKYKDICRDNFILLNDDFITEETFYKVINIFQKYIDLDRLNKKIYDIATDDKVAIISGLNNDDIYFLNKKGFREIYSIFKTAYENVISYETTMRTIEEINILRCLFEKEEKKNLNVGMIVKNLFDKGMIDFVYDYLNNINDFIKSNTFSKEIYSQFLNNLLVKGKFFDRYILLPFKINDIFVINLWKDLVEKNCNKILNESNKSLDNIYYENINNKYKKFIFLMLFDRKTLKTKINYKYRRNKVLLNIIRVNYKILRKIWRLIK